MEYNNKNTTSSGNSTPPTRRKKKKSTPRLIIRVLLVVLLVGCFAVAGALIGAYFGIISSAEKLNALAVQPDIFSSKIVIDETGETYATLEATENREYVTIDTLPDYVGNAFVAIEDSRFYEHNGIDLKGIVRSFYLTVTHQDMQGGSTITQQLIKNVRGLQRNTLKTKLQEQYLAVQYEKDMTEAYGSKEAAKEKILEIYLNTINLGGDYNGVQTASRHYFNKDASELTISEAAVLAAITQYPSKHNPIYYPENNKQRQQTVLEYMLEQGYITDDEYLEAINDDVYSRIADYNVNLGSGSKDSYYTDQVKIEVAKDLAVKYKITEKEAYNMLFNAGLEIRIPIDTQIQDIVEEAYLDDSNFPSSGYKIQVTYVLDVKSGTDGKTNHYEERKFVKNKDGISAFEEEVKAKYVGPNDEIIAQSTYPVVQPQSSFVVIDNQTGYVKAIQGGRGEKLADLGLNRATGSKRQPGSTFKIVSAFGPGIDNGTLTLGTAIDDVPFQTFRNWYSNPPYRGLSTVREGIRDSMNIVAVKAMDMVGIDVAFDYLENFGFTTLVDQEVTEDGRVLTDRGLSTALGGLTYGVTNLELTASFETIANNGEYRKPVFYTKVIDHEGNVILDNTVNESKTVIKPTTAYLLTSAMQDVVTSGTGTPVKFSNVSMPIAGKTGTTSDSKDLWFVGYTPYYTAGVWLGYDDPETIPDGVYHKQLWKKVMEKVHAEKGLERKEFVKPEGITTASICKESGQLASQLCSGDPRGSTVYTEYFESGTVPSEYCSVHQSAQVDSVSGLKATENCPEAQVVSKVFIVRPDGSVAAGNVGDAVYQLANLANCDIDHGAKPTEPTNKDENLVEGVDYYIDPVTGEKVYANPGSNDASTDAPTTGANGSNSAGGTSGTDTTQTESSGNTSTSTTQKPNNSNSQTQTPSNKPPVQPTTPPVEIPDFVEQ